MNTGKDRIITGGIEWDQIISQLAQYNLNDIYFDHRYISLYTSKNDTCEAFLYEHNERFFFLPYIRRVIPPILTGSGIYYDFESAYGYSGPLITPGTDDSSFTKMAWQAFFQHCKATKMTAGFIRFHPLLKNHLNTDDNIITTTFERKTVFIDLDKTPDQVWKNYSKENRNKIRKAINHNVFVSEEQGLDALRMFSNIYRTRMAEINASDEYLFSEQYFTNMDYLGKDQYKLYFAHHQSGIIGAALVLFSPYYAHYHLSASPREYSGYAPNNILRHEVIQRLNQKQYKQLHFGGGITNDPSDSLLRFKKGFSKQTSDFYTGRCIVDRETYNLLCHNWENNNPDKAKQYKHYVLKYRKN